MKITAIIRDDQRPEGWEETLTGYRDGWPSEVVQGILDNFNATLRVGERPRYLVRVVGYEFDGQQHDWVKSNLVTVIKRGLNYDTVKCSRCGATGKRYGLSPRITLDLKFTKWCVFK